MTIIFESYISANDTRLTFEAAGLTPHLDVQPVASPWPTLRQMIATDRRLVVFTDNQGGTYDWYHTTSGPTRSRRTYCSRRREPVVHAEPRQPGERPFILNHFLTQTFRLADALAGTDQPRPAVHRPRANQCAAEDAHLPNFVTVDHYQIGDVFPVVDALNGL